MIASFLSSLWWRRFLSRNARSWTDLDRFESFSPEQQRRELAERLLEQIRYFGNRADALPEWREAARLSDPAELWRIWPSLPVMTKGMLRERFPATEIRDRFGLTGQVRSTGGSTGEPTQFFHDTAMVKASVGGRVYTQLRMGWRLGMPTVIVWGSERDIGRQTANWRLRTLSRFLREYMVDGYRLSEATVNRVLSLLRATRPAAVYGFTSMLEYVARAVLARGERLPAGSVRTAWNGGEALSPEQSQVFEQAFGVPILNRYGGREISTIACQFRAAEPLRVLRPWVFLEVLDANGRPVPSGEIGRLVVTSTICRGTPFLRYDIGDLGVYNVAGQSESGIGALAELQGRSAGLITLPDGRTINNLYWNHLFKEFPEVRQFQVVWKRNGEIWISLVGAGLPEAREAQLRAMTNHLLSGVPLKLLWTDEIPRTAQGKLVQTLRES